MQQVCILLNFTVAFNCLSYLQLLKVCFTNFDRGNQKIHGRLDSSANISTNSFSLCNSNPHAVSYFSAVRQSVNHFMRVP